jgi:hypothetical protein
MRSLIWLLLVACIPATSAEETKAGSVKEPRFAEIPKASTYLTEQLAAGFLRAKVREGPANEHIPTFWSQCMYAGVGVRSRDVQFVFKFMLWDLFDVAGLHPQQLLFNVTFAMSNTAPLERLDDLGKATFIYEKQHASMLLMITGIQGPPDGAGRPTELIATYRLSDPETPHKERVDKLLAQARRHLEEWLAQSQP